MPPGATTSWPEEMYARDVAKAFSMIAALSGDAGKNLRAKFHIVFPGAKFVHTTAHRQFRAWKLSTEAERQALLELDRTPAGRWTAIRSGLSGWLASRSQKQLSV